MANQYSWDKLGVLGGTPEKKKKKDFTGGIDYDNASADTVFSNTTIDPTKSSSIDYDDMFVDSPTINPAKTSLDNYNDPNKDLKNAPNFFQKAGGFLDNIGKNFQYNQPDNNFNQGFKTDYYKEDTEGPSYMSVAGNATMAGTLNALGGFVNAARVPYKYMAGNPDNTVMHGLDNAYNYLDKKAQTYEDKLKDIDTYSGKGFVKAGFEGIPQVATAFIPGAALGKVGKVAGLGEKAVTALQMTPFGLQAGGNYASEAEKEGATTGQQLAYGIAGGVLEAASETLPLKNLKKLIGGNAEKLINGGAETLIGKYGKLGLEYLKGVGKEAAQEAFIDPATGLAKKAIYKPDMNWTGKDGVWDNSQMAQDAWGGAAMSVLLSAFGMPINMASHRMASHMIENNIQPTQENINKIHDQVMNDFQTFQAPEVNNGGIPVVNQDQQENVINQPLNIQQPTEQQGLNINNIPEVTQDATVPGPIQRPDLNNMLDNYVPQNNINTTPVASQEQQTPIMQTNTPVENNVIQTSPNDVLNTPTENTQPVEEKTNLDIPTTVEPGQKYKLKNLGEVTVKSNDGNKITLEHSSGKEIPINTKNFNKLNPQYLGANSTNVKNTTVENQINDTETNQEQPQVKEKEVSQVNTPTENTPSQNASTEATTYKVNDEVMLMHDNKVDAGTISKINSDGTYEIQRPEGDYVIAKKDGDKFESIQSAPTAKEDLPLEDRSNQNVGNKKIKAYQYLHPELKSHIQDEAKVMLGELKDTQKASRYGVDANGETKPIGEQRITSDDIAYLRDTVGMSYADIEKGLNKLIEDNGSENNAASKKIELVIDHRLSHGYREFNTGTDVEVNKDYIAKKNNIEGRNEKLNTNADDNNQEQDKEMPLDNKNNKSIEDYIDYALNWNGKSPKQESNFDLGIKILPEIAKLIKEKIKNTPELSHLKNIDVSGYTHHLVDNDLRHINKRHGSKSTEKYPVTPEDLKDIPNIVSNPDAIYLGKPTDKGQITIYYEKRHNGTTYYLEYAANEDKTLNGKQMIKVSTGKRPSFIKERNLVSRVDVSNTTNPSMNVHNAVNQVPNNSISNKDNNINTEKVEENIQKSAKEEIKQENPLATITNINNKFRRGETLTLEEIKNHAEYVINNEEIIKAEISKLKNAELDKMLSWNARSYPKKEDKVNAIYHSQLNRIYYDIADTDRLSGFTYGGKVSIEDQMKAKIKAALEKLTQEKLNSILVKNKKSYNEAAERRKAKIEAIKNPTTLEEFEDAKRYRKLTPEEQRQYEELKALDIKAKEKEKETKVITTLNNTVEDYVKNTDYDVTQTKHTKTDEDLWVVKFKTNIGGNDFKDLNNYMKSLGGPGYSKFVRGFIFPFDPSEKINSIKSGQVVETSKEETKPNREKQVADKLREVADNMQKTIDDKLADRLTNTARRANMAASAEAEGEALKKQQQIIRNIADLIESGEAVHLDGISARTHIETLEGILRRTKNDYAKNLSYEKYPSQNGYDNTTSQRHEYQKELLRKSDTEFNSIDIAEYPLTKTYDETLRQLVKETTSISGTARLRQKIDKAILQNKIKGNEHYINTKNIAEDIIELYDKLKKSGKDFSRDYDLVDYKRLQTMGIKNTTMLRAALREFYKAKGNFELSPEEIKAKKVKELERSIIGTKIESYFPTPKNIVERMLEEANIKEGENILEPSAGSGHIADMIKEEYPDNNLEVGEYNSTLLNILKEKGHNVVSSDFLSHKGQYDKIIMNPPFEKNQDIIHVQHAYEQLKPGGRIVAIMSEHPFFANDKKSVEFREWLDELGGTSEKLPEGSFKESDRSTGVNTRMVIIDKPLNSKLDTPNQFKGEGDKIGIVAPGFNSNSFKTDKHKFNDEEVNKRYEAARGIEKTTVYHRIIQWLHDFKNMSTRTYRYIDEKNPELSELKKEMTLYSKYFGLAADETIRILDDITQNLGKNHYDIFSKYVMLKDLQEEASKDHKLPFGFTKDMVDAELQRLQPYMLDNIKQSIEKRGKYWESLKDNYISAMDKVGFDVADRFNKENYFRHMVLDKVVENQISKGGRGKARVSTGRGFLKQRGGSELDINSDYLQAEYEVMAQMIRDTKVAEMQSRIINKYDISKKLKEEAKKLTEEATKDLKEEVKDLREQLKDSNLTEEEKNTINEKISDLKEEINSKTVNWHNLVPEGYQIMQLREGNTYYTATTLSEKLVDEIINNVPNEVGVSADKLRSALAVGKKYPEYVFDENIINTLNQVSRNIDVNPAAAVTKKVLNTWKRWVLGVNPHSFFRYNIRNMTGDLDKVIAANPAIVKYSARATHELYAAMKHGRFSPDMLEFYNRGGFNALTIPQEIAEVNDYKKFEKFNRAKSGIKVNNIFAKYIEGTEFATNLRESILRYSTFLYAKEQLKKGKPLYWASKPSEIDGLKNTIDKAYKLSNDLLGAYDEVTETGKIIRDYWIPFYSWLEVNFKGYTQLLKNNSNMDIIEKQLNYKGKDANAVNKTGQLLLNNSTFIVKAALLSAILAAWNTVVTPDDDDELSEDIKKTVHITLGHDKNGNVWYFNRLGSLSDFLEWFGLSGISSDMKDLELGRKTGMEQFVDMLKRPVNKFVSGVNPFVKTTGELLTGKKLYPDIFKPSTIRDKRTYIGQALGLDYETKSLLDIPKESNNTDVALGFLGYKSDPKANAYYSILDKKREFEKDVLGQYPTESFSSSPKSLALYYYKLALKQNDQKLAQKYLDEYYNNGGTEKGIDQSLKMMSPVYGLVENSKQNRHENSGFINYLTSEERQQLTKAMQYYNDLVNSGPIKPKPSNSKTKTSNTKSKPIQFGQ